MDTDSPEISKKRRRTVRKINIIVFKKDQKPKIYEYLDKIGSEKEIIVFGSRMEADAFIDSLA